MSEPTREHIEAVSDAIGNSAAAIRRGVIWTSRYTAAENLLTSTDPAVWDAIAAHIPMDALVRTGRLRVAHTPYRDEGGYRRSETRLVTEWTEAPDA